MSIEPNISVIDTIVILGAVIGLLLSVFLLTWNKNNFTANQFLSLFIFVISLTLLHQFLIESGYILLTTLYIGVTVPLEYLLPPSLYLYVAKLTEISITKFKVRWHFIPAMIGLILFMPFYFLEFNTQYLIITQFFDSNLLSGMLYYTFPFFVIGTGVQSLVYLVLIIVLLISHKKNTKHYFSYQKHMTLSWLYYFLLLVLVCWFIIIALNGVNLLEQSFDNSLYLFSIVVILYIGIMAIIQRTIYEPKDLLHRNEVPENLAMNTDISEKIKNRLIEVMQNEKPYQKYNVRFYELANLVAVSPSNLRYVLTQQLQTNFFDYINSFRIDSVNTLLLESITTKQSFINVLFKSGFKSKSDYYRARKLNKCDETK